MLPFLPRFLPFDDLDLGLALRVIVQANSALAMFKGTLIGVPNPEVLLAPLTMKEAVLSSRIEGTQATVGDVFRYEAGETPTQESRRNDVFEIINYRKALHIAQEELKTRPFSLNLLKRLHEILLDSVRGRHKARGQFRTVQNWIGGAGTTMEQAQFVPPEPLRVPELLNNWESYYHYDEVDALVQLAIVHAQFEIIHPFLDGNGRLGRILVPLFLYEKGLLASPVFYISAYLEEHREKYIEQLRQLDNTPESWLRWIVFFMNAIRAQAQKNTETAMAVMQLYARLKERVIECTRSQYAVPLLDQCFRRPVFTSAQIALGPGGPTYASISKMLLNLREAGVLQVVREGSGRRPQIFSLHELVSMCEA
ncbi:Fic family protein [Megalodesulfovibrio paquesii]